MANEMKTNDARGGQQGVTRRSEGAPLMLSPGDLFRMGPFSLMRRMAEEMNHVFGEGGFGRGESARAWTPAIEVSEKDGRFVVRADLPGIDPNDVKLEVTDNAIIIEGERKSEQEQTKEGVHITERQYGRFYRSIPLPEGAKTEEAKARFENGVLEVTVPEQEQKSKRRQVQIETTPTNQTSSTDKAA
jgi:HSP20 family protein